MKTIGYVLNEFPVLSETFVGNEMRAMATLGHKVVPIVLRRPNGPAQPEDIKFAQNAVHVAELSHMAALRGAFSIGFSSPKALSYLRNQTTLPGVSLFGNALKIAAIAKAHGCSHLHAHFAGPAAAHAVVAGHWANITTSFVCHGYDIYGNPTDLPLKLRNANFIVSVCNDMTDDLRALLPTAHLSMVPCGTDPNRFTIPCDKSENGRLLFIGRLVEQKGLTELVDALAMAGPEAAPLDIVGDGPLRHDLEAQAARHGLDETRISFLGAKNADWIAENGHRYLGLLAPFRAASTGQRDTGPVVIKEAMAMGLPVIGTRFMGIKEMITADTGFLVDVGDTGQLSQAITALSQMTGEQRASMGRAGRQRVIEKFSLHSQSVALSGLVEAA